MVNDKSAPAALPAGVVNPSLAAAGSPGGSPAGTGTTGNGGAGSNPNGNAGGGGNAAGTSAPGVILGSAAKARGGLRNELTAIAHGIGTQFPDGTETLNVRGQLQTRAQLLNAIAALVALFADVDGARQSLKSKRLALEAALPDVRDFVASIRAALVGLFGPKNPVLENFGINPRKPRILTAKQSTARAAKSEATRELRGTRSKRQKADVKFAGTVEVQTKLSGPQTAGGFAPAAGTEPSSAGAPAGVPPGSSQP